MKTRTQCWRRYSLTRKQKVKLVVSDNPCGNNSSLYPLQELVVRALALLLCALAGCTGIAEVATAETAPGVAKVADCSALSCDAGVVAYIDGCSCACDGDGGIGIWADLPLTPGVLEGWQSCVTAICGGSVCDVK